MAIVRFNLHSDDTVVASVDQLMYELKVMKEKTKLSESLRDHLRDFIIINKLDTDPHCFASIPE